MKQVSRIAIAFALPVMLSACATGDDRYPSLNVRPGERATGSFAAPEEQPTPSPVPEETAGLLAQVEKLQSEAEEAHGNFTQAAPQARTLVQSASGAATGSDSWASAQIALADLDSARSQAAISLASLDVLHMDATLGGTALAAIDSARTSVLEMLQAEDATLAELRAMLDS